MCCILLISHGKILVVATVTNAPQTKGMKNVVVLFADILGTQWKPYGSKVGASPWLLFQLFYVVCQ